MVLTTTVDNSAESTGQSSNPYVCEDTEDKLFLLSYKEVTNADYGLSKSSNRKMLTSDYARANGVLMSTSTDYYGNASWWLRSPHYQWDQDPYRPVIGVKSINSEGVISYSKNEGHHVDYNYGVAPALWITL